MCLSRTVFPGKYVVIEVVRTTNRRDHEDICEAAPPPVPVNYHEENSDFFVLLDHENGKGPGFRGYLRKDRKVAVFEAGENPIYSESSRNLGNAVKNACNAIRKSLQQKRRGGG